MRILNRACPTCTQPTIPFWRLMFWRVRCVQCQAEVSANPAWRLPLLSVETVAWFLALNWLKSRFGDQAVPISFAVWIMFDLLVDRFVPLAARLRPPA